MGEIRQQYLVGQRVQVSYGADVIKPHEIECNVGIIIGARLDRPFHPDEVTRMSVTYTVLLDRQYLKSQYNVASGVGRKIHVREDQILKVLLVKKEGK
jgi:hypothetical protein